MASDNDNSSNNHNLDGSLKSNKKLANSGSIGKRLIVLLNYKIILLFMEVRS